MPVDPDLELAASLATGAGELLEGLRRRGSPTGTEGDLASNRYLLARLAAERPHDAVLSEESADNPARLEADRVWIIDPLDGSREFAERASDGRWRDDYAVHVALWTRAVGLAGGAVGQPARSLVYRSEDPPLPSPGTGDGPLRIAVSRTRPPGLVRDLADAVPVEFVAMGSAGVKTMAVVTGDVDAYVHAGGQYEWDSAAPAAVALGVGLHASRIDGSPLIYNAASPWLPDLVVCRRDRAASLLALIRTLEGEKWAS